MVKDKFAKRKQIIYSRKNWALTISVWLIKLPTKQSQKLCAQVKNQPIVFDDHCMCVEVVKQWCMKLFFVCPFVGLLTLNPLFRTRHKIVSRRAGSRSPVKFI